MPESDARTGARRRFCGLRDLRDRGTGDCDNDRGELRRADLVWPCDARIFLPLLFFVLFPRRSSSRKILSILLRRQLSAPNGVFSNESQGFGTGCLWARAKVAGMLWKSTRLLYLERFYSRQTIQCTSAVESVRHEPWSICRLGVIGNDYEVRGLQVAGAMFVENFLVT